MKLTIVTLALLSTLVSCSDGPGFKAEVGKGELVNKAADALPSADAVAVTPAEVPLDPAVEQARVDSVPVVPVAPDLTSEAILDVLPIALSVLLPAPEILSGSKTMTVVAQPSRDLDAGDKIIFSLPAGAVGTLVPNADGRTAVYTSPASLVLDTSVLIKATLASDAKISGAETLKVTRKEKAFVGCQNGKSSAYYPVQGKVYIPTALKMAQLLAIGPVPGTNGDGRTLYTLPPVSEVLDPTLFSHVATVCMPNFDIAKRDEPETGFPNAETVKTNYDIQFDTILEVPVAGSYQFEAAMDDGAQISLDGALIPMGRDVVLSKGFHELKVNYYNGPRRFNIQLSWKKPGDALPSIIPTENFKPAQ